MGVSAVGKPSMDDVRQAVGGREAWARETLAGWVRYPSVLGEEAPAQEYIAGVLETLGFSVRTEAVDIDAIRRLPGFGPVDWSYAGRPNVVGLLDGGRAEGRSMIFNGHVDVVSPEPAKLWTTAPFEPRIERDEASRETWMVGRGAGDMKGGSVSFLWAVAALRDMGLAPASPLTFESVIEEECTGNGTLDLCAKGYRADGCLIPEPFAETVLHRQVGVLWFQTRVLGKTTHVLGAGRGVNAIEKSWLLIQAMHALEEEMNRPENVPETYRGIDHPINLNVGIIQGGDWASTVAGECVTRFRLGLFPGQRCSELMRRIEERVAAAASRDPWLKHYPPTVEYIGFQAEGSTFELGSELGKALYAAHAAWRGKPPSPLVATCTTDARTFLLHYGMPSTCYGPAALDIHGVDEKVSIDSMRRVAEVTTTLLDEWCGLRKAG